MPTAQLSIYCPSMPVHSVNRKLRRTAAEPMVATITFEDGSTLAINPVTIPETDVHRLGLLHWQVDACIGSGNDGANNFISVSLPVEPVLFNLQDFTMVAQAIVADVLLLLANGVSWTGTVTFPDCPTDLMTGTAQAITATGQVSLP